AGLLDDNPASARTAEHPDERVYNLLGAWTGHPLGMAYLWRTLDLAAAHGVAVYWLMPPVHPRVQARRDRLGLDAAYVAAVRQALARYPNLTVIDGRRSGYPPDAFADGSHLNVRGACAFTEDLAA